MNGFDGNAIVIGAGMGGLAAAAALAEHYPRVTLIERDELPETAEPRRAIPQGRHAHALLPRGQMSLEALLPGFTADVIAAGAIPFRALLEMRFSVGGHQLARCDRGVDSIVASRPLIETMTRERVRALPNVELRERCEAVELLAGSEGRRVRGVRVRDRDGGAAQELDADLVVAASGRAAKLGRWLERIGWQRPVEERIEVGFGYASRHLQLAPGALGSDKVVLVGARPGMARTLALFAQENDRWLLTLGGYCGDHPPTDEEGFLEFASAVAPPDVAEAIRAAKPLDEIATFGFPANRRRRFRRLPVGLVPLGDAICAFNPIYGQGMAVATTEALALRDCLAAGRDGVERRYLKAADAIVDHAWTLAGGGDLAQPVVPGHRPLRVRLVNAYLRRLFAAAAHDEFLADVFLGVSGLLEPPPTLLHPRVIARVVRTARRAERRAAHEVSPQPASG